jgi:DNA polymerase III subunit delta
VKHIALDHWLNTETGQHSVPQVLCVFTDEPLFLTQATDTYRIRLKQQTNYQRHVIELDRQFDPQAFLALFAEASLFGDVSLVDMRLPQPKLNKEVAEALNKAMQWITNGQTNHHLLICGPKLHKTQEKSDGFAQLLKLGCEVACKPIDNNSLPSWIAQSAARKGIELKRDTCAWLAEKTEGNLLAAHQTLEKLAVEHTGPVELATVQAMVSNSARFNVFDLGANLLAGDTQRVARMIDGLQAEGEAATLVLWALQEEIRALRDTQASMRRGMSLADCCRQHAP